MKIEVIDLRTGEYPDVEDILTDEWVKHRNYDIGRGFYIDEDGVVIVKDKCRNTVYCKNKNLLVRLIIKRTDFKVIDPKTGEYPNLEHIARDEEWAQNLIPCDMEGFCINEDGNLLLMDECGNYAYCPEDRFQVNFKFPVYSREY